MQNLIKKLKINRRFIATLAGLHYYGNPSKNLKIIGVTGTNGKTTVATLLYKLFSKLGYKVGLISTVENIIIDEVRPATHTTPGPIPLNKLLTEMVEKGCEYVFMEVSSHAMDQSRVAGIKFTGGIFTNLTHDHLDYHGNFENYFKAKKKFFRMLPESAFALSNSDDEYGFGILEDIKAKTYTYGLKNPANFVDRLDTKLIGEFNIYNILAVYSAAILLGEDKIRVKEIIKDLEPVDGRFNYIKSKNNITGIVDFAHTPDALENVLRTIQGMRKDGQKIITLFGCGGDRDPSKRSSMTSIAYKMSDITIATSDNPRNEKIENIFSDMKVGLPENLEKELFFISDRVEAIEKACSIGMPNDFILLAGKGHEKYQQIGKEKIPFNDMEELKKNLI